MIRPNFRPKIPCKSPDFTRLADKQNAQLASKHKPPDTNSNQDKQGPAEDNNIPKTDKKVPMQTTKRPRKQQIHRKIDQKSDWNDADSEDSKDDQARCRPINVDLTLDQGPDMDQKPSTSNPNTSAPLRRPTTWPKVLDFGTGRGRAPLENWTSVIKGCGPGLHNVPNITQTPPAYQEPIVDKNLAIVAPTDGIQHYERNLAPRKPRKDLANWTWVRLGDTRARITYNNRTEQGPWQRPNDNDATEDYLDPDIVERDAIQSDEEGPSSLCCGVI